MSSTEENPSKGPPVKHNNIDNEKVVQRKVPPKLVFTRISLTIDDDDNVTSESDIQLNETNSKLKKALSLNVTLRTPSLLQPSSYISDTSSSTSTTSSSSSSYINKPKGRPSLSRSDALDETRRPHRIQSFISKHFGKNLPKTRRPLGASLSCEIESQIDHLSSSSSTSKESWKIHGGAQSFSFSIPHTQLESICLHCCATTNYREKFLITKFENISQIWLKDIDRYNRRSSFLGYSWSFENPSKITNEMRTISDVSNTESISSGGWSSLYSR